MSHKKCKCSHCKGTKNIDMGKPLYINFPLLTLNRYMPTNKDASF